MYRASLILLLYTGEALAHPDHGVAGWLSAELLHLLSEPDHLAIILAPLLLGVIWFARAVRKARSATRSTRS